MLRHKRDRRYDEWNSLSPGPANLLVGRGPNPFHRPDTALITHVPVDARPLQGADYCCCSCLDLARIGVARTNDRHRQTMCGEEQAWRPLEVGSRIEYRPDQLSHGLGKAVIRRIAAHNAAGMSNTGVSCRRPPRGE